MTKFAIKVLCDVKVTGSKIAGKKNLSMLRVHVAQDGCNPQVILTAYIPLSHSFLATD
jgi:hypothetical protein